MSDGEERLLLVSSDGHVGPPAETYRKYVDPEYRNDFDEWLSQYVPVWLATKPKDPELPVTWSEDYKRHWLEQDEVRWGIVGKWDPRRRDRKSTRLNSSHGSISYAVFCLKKKKIRK